MAAYTAAEVLLEREIELSPETADVAISYFPSNSGPISHSDDGPIGKEGYNAIFPDPVKWLKGYDLV